MKIPDWLIHVAVSAVIMIVGWWIGHLYLVGLANAVFWPAREFYQHTSDGRFFSAHVVGEWLPPIIIVIPIFAWDLLRG